MSEDIKAHVIRTLYSAYSWIKKLPCRHIESSDCNDCSFWFYGCGLKPIVELVSFMEEHACGGDNP